MKIKIATCLNASNDNAAELARHQMLEQRLMAKCMPEARQG